jgi:5'-AMP-activated protein kinase catalytic alpha subunit
MVYRILMWCGRTNTRPINHNQKHNHTNQTKPNQNQPGPIHQVARLGFDQEMLVASLRNREQNKATVTYYLIADNRRRTPSSGYLSGEMQEGAAAAAAGAGFGGGSFTQQQQQQQQAGGGAAGGHRAHPSAPSGGGGLPQQRLVAERKWRLGVAARGHPSALMAELYRVLQVGAGFGC